MCSGLDEPLDEPIMTLMRPRLVALALSAMLVAVLVGGCKFAGVSAVYMAIDSGGAQRRDVFFADSTSVYCVTKFSSAKQDATVDFTVRETADATGKKVNPPSVFAVDEETPGAGTEQIVSYDIPQQGIMVTIMCNGVCVQHGIGCPEGSLDQGDNTCGPNADCCYEPFTMAMPMASAIPYPVGSYECEVDVDGDVVGITDFTIDYPTTTNGAGSNCPVPPPFNGVICEGWVQNGTQCPGSCRGRRAPVATEKQWSCPQ